MIMSERPVITTEDVVGCMECGVIFTPQVNEKCQYVKNKLQPKSVFLFHLEF